MEKLDLAESEVKEYWNVQQKVSEEVGLAVESLSEIKSSESITNSNSVSESEVTAHQMKITKLFGQDLSALQADPSFTGTSYQIENLRSSLILDAYVNSNSVSKK